MRQNRRSSTRPWTPASEIRETLRVISRSRSGSRSALRTFARWLYRNRGLAAGTVTVRVHSAGILLDTLTSRSQLGLRGSVSALTEREVEQFFVRYGLDHGMASRRSMQAAMRLFFLFAEEQGWAGPELRESVPMLRTSRLKSLPRGIDDEELEVLLTASWGRGACRHRNRAIILLLATYGVRRGQISRLRFEDLDWHERTIAFAAHKGGHSVRHSLSPAAAQALSEYLGHERPRNCDPHVFLRHRRPHLRLSPASITEVVRSRAQSCGLPVRSAHAFRHAFATRLLRSGEPMKVISDLLGHRSVDAVAIYAKVDFQALSECCVEWPEVSS
jgi:integrase